MTGLTILSPTRVPYRSPTGVRGSVRVPSVTDLYLGTINFGSEASPIIRWNAKDKIFEDIGLDMSPDGLLHTRRSNNVYVSMCFWRGKLIIAGAYDSGDQLFAFDGNTWLDIPAVFMNGTRNYPSPGTPNPGRIKALTVYNGNLIAGGAFNEVNGTPIKNIAQFDGQTWSPIGTYSPTQDFSAEVDLFGCMTLVVYVGQLYAGGLNLQKTTTPFPYRYDCVIRLEPDGNWLNIDPQNANYIRCHRLQVNTAGGSPGGALTAYFVTNSDLARGGVGVFLWSGIPESEWLKLMTTGVELGGPEFQAMGTLGPDIVVSDEVSTRTWNSGVVSVLPNSNGFSSLLDDYQGYFMAGNSNVADPETGHTGPWRRVDDIWQPIGLRTSTDKIHQMLPIKRSLFTSHESEPVVPES